MSKCPHCASEAQQIKIGFSRSGSQRWLCKVCRRQYTPESKQHGYGEAMHQPALAHHVDGLNYRRIARVLGIKHQSVSNWVPAHSDSLPDASPVPADQLEVK